MKCLNCRSDMQRSPGADTELRGSDGRIRRRLTYICPKCRNVATVDQAPPKPYTPPMELK